MKQSETIMQRDGENKRINARGWGMVPVTIESYRGPIRLGTIPDLVGFQPRLEEEQNERARGYRVKTKFTRQPLGWLWSDLMVMAPRSNIGPRPSRNRKYLIVDEHNIRRLDISFSDVWKIEKKNLYLSLAIIPPSSDVCAIGTYSQRDGSLKHGRFRGLRLINGTTSEVVPVLRYRTITLFLLGTFFISLPFILQWLMY